MRDQHAKAHARTRSSTPPIAYSARNGYKKMTIDDLAARSVSERAAFTCIFRARKRSRLSHIDRIIERLKNRLAEIALKRMSM